MHKLIGEVLWDVSVGQLERVSLIKEHRQVHFPYFESGYWHWYFTALQSKLVLGC